MMSRFRWLFAMVAMAALPAMLSAQATGVIRGTVVDASTERPLQGAQVFVAGTSLGSLSDAAGRFTISNAPAGTHTLRVQLLGFSAGEQRVTVAAGQVATVTFRMASSAIALEGLVVTGVSGGGTERAKVPFTVSRVDASQMPVQAVNPLSQLQGRVPGANIASISGRPGVAPSVILRGPTSINAAGRGQEPLYIVDGVVLGSSIADINPADIESVEVVKGAAASTLYGSRAAAGVISITTRRGSLDGIRFTARSEYGLNDIERDFGIARNHPFLLDESGTRFCVLDAYGSANLCSRTIDYQTEQRRINNTPGDFALGTVAFPVDPGAVTSGDILRRAFVAGNWPGTTYNAVQQLVDPKPLTLNDFSMSGRLNNTTFFTSVGHTQQGGAIAGLKGYERLNARVNLGQRVGENLSVDINSYISRSTADGSNQEEGGAGFFRLTRSPAVVDITQRDDFGRLYIRPNLGSAGVQNENPLYSFENIAREDVRWRYLIGGTARYTPIAWLDADANFSLDRLNFNFLQFSNRGFRTTNANPATNQGLIFNGVNNSQSINSTAGVTLRPALSDWVNTSVNLRWLYEQQNFDGRNIQGQFLRVADVRSGANATQQQQIASSSSETRQMGLSAGTFIDILDRYTFDLAIRRDGNSRFGADNRWQTYGRASAAWLMAREAWFPSDFLTAFTVRASYGTAGNAPSYAAQYETYSIGAGGSLTAGTLGNPNLRPEVVTEFEVGGDVELLNRYVLTLAYANSLARDQILPVPVPVSTGFPRQWQNAGEMRNETYEAALTLPLLQGNRGFNWTARVNYTNNTPTVEKLNVPPFFIGTGLQATEGVIRIEEGLRYGTLYGRQFMRSCSQLPGNFAQQCGAGQPFQINQDGYVVWVGQGNNPGMGITHNLWNAQLPGAAAPYGVATNWGMPLLVRNPDTGSPIIGDVGHALPDFRIGMSHTMSYRNVSLYGLFEGAFGQSVWNQGKHWAHLDFLSADLDQGARTVQDAKPIGYFYRAGPGPGGNPSGLGGLYDILSPSNHMVEDASFVKLRELSLSYNVGRLANFGDWTVSVVGRNLKTWTDYSGFDPEVGVGGSGEAGSGLVNAIDAFTFPQLRSLSFVFSTSF
jgi:TonB-linked SusC/RagA family outer membrane protein